MSLLLVLSKYNLRKTPLKTMKMESCLLCWLTWVEMDGMPMPGPASKENAGDERVARLKFSAA